jgi:hypothetical protein
MKPITKADVEARIARGESLRSIAKHFGVTHQAICWRRDQWGCKRIRAAWGANAKRAAGQFIDQWGYVMVRTSNRAGGLACTPQHILVAEEMLGRKLKSGERVHHVNGIKDDNRPDNLYVYDCQSAHKNAHTSLEAVAMQLVRDGVIKFHNGTYHL